MLAELKKSKIGLGLAVSFSLLGLLPLIGTSFVPLHDLPDHVGLAALAWDVIQPGTLAHQELALQSYPVPYLSLYLFIALLSPVFGALVSAKLFVALCVLCLPWGVMRLLWALGKDPRLGLLGFLLVWDFSLSWGFVAYHLGVGLVFWALSFLVRAKCAKDVMKTVLVFILAALTHAQSYGILVVAALFLLPSLTDWKKRLSIFGATLFLGGAPLIPWIWIRATSEGTQKAPKSWIEFHSLSKKLQMIFDCTLDVLPAKAVPHLPGMVLIFFGLAIFVLMILPQKRARALPYEGMALVGVGAFLYFGMPHAITWPIDQWLIYERHATFLLVTFMFLPDPQWQKGRNIVLFFALGVQFVWMSTMYEHFSAFGQRAEPFKKIIEAVPENQAIIMLTLQDNDPAVKRSPYNQFHAYIVAEKGGYDPFLFDNKSHPVVHRNRDAWPRPEWRRMNRFSMEKHGKHYDYIVIQGLRRDPIKKYKNTPNLAVEEVIEAGRWRLYKIIRGS